MRMILFSLRRRLLICSCFALLPVTAAYGQQTKPTIPPPAADTIPVVNGVSPRGAFLRSLLLPGWGQFSVGAAKRGAAFVVLESASWFMLLKTLNKLGDAQAVEDRLAAPVRDSLRAKMTRDTALARVLANPRAFEERVLADSTVSPAHSLVLSRKQQRQDWITYTIFTTLASGVDAYVAAHLADFPATISAQPGSAGGVRFQVTVPRR